MRIQAQTLALVLLFAAGSANGQTCVNAFKLKPQTAASLAAKQSLKQALPSRLRKGLIQLTGRDLQFGQKKFPERGPADPFPFVDKNTGKVYIYGTQVDGTGFSYLEYPNMGALLRNEPAKMISEKVYLPNGKVLKGKEALWDTTRVAYFDFERVFGKENLAEAFQQMGIDPQSDLFFAGAALQPDGKLGEWTRDNWRRRNHVLVRKNGKLQILKDPVFNKIAASASEKDYVGFGQLSFLPGDYIGHAYGPNFKMQTNKETGDLEMWIISEEVTRRIDVDGKPAEITEIVARKMVSPFEASKVPSDRKTLVSVDGKDGKPHPDSDRGPEMGNTKLIEGFRPTSIEPEGIKISKREVLINGKWKLVEDSSLSQQEAFVMTGSQGNFAGDGYDAILAARLGSAIGHYDIVTTKGDSWKKFLKGLKQKYNLSWAGRASFLDSKQGIATQGEDGRWYLLFHGVDKDIRPDGSYGGVIPPDTETYHRNVYMVPIEFYVNRSGKVDMKLLY